MTLISTTGIASQQAGVQRLLDAGLDRRDILLGNVPARDGVDELKPRARLQRLDFDDSVPILTAPAGLLDMALVDLGVPGDSLFVGNLRPAVVGLYFEFPIKPVQDDLQVQFAHARR